jgi:Zn-finger nucleic acid-binding protein
MNQVLQCPRCDVPIREREKGDVIIDVCPQCRGVWLDPGELERLGEREARYYDDDDDDEGWGRGGWNDREARRESRVQSYPRNGQSGQRQHKKKGFLSSLMENFGEGGAGDD